MPAPAPKRALIPAAVLLIALLVLAWAGWPIQAQDGGTPTPAGNILLVDDVYLRGGPSRDYPAVGQLTADFVVSPVARNAAGDWIMIRYWRGGFGWVRQDLVRWADDLSALPVIADGDLTPTVLPEDYTATPFFPTETPSGNWVDVGPQGAFVRAGPGRGYLVLGAVQTGDILEPLARDEGTFWIMVRYRDGFGWLPWNFVQWADDMDLATLPVMPRPSTEQPDALTPSATFTPSATPSRTPTATMTGTATATSTNTATATATLTLTLTATPSDTATMTATDVPTATPTLTHTATATYTATDLPTNTATAIPTDTPTDTASPEPSDTPEPTATLLPTGTATATPTATDLPTNTPTAIPTDAPTDAPTDTATAVLPTDTAVPTVTATAVPPTDTAVPTATDTPTGTPTDTPPPTFTDTAAPSDTASPTDTATATPSDTPTATATATLTTTPTNTHTPTEVIAVLDAPPTFTPQPSPQRLASDTPEPTTTETPEPTATATDEPTQTVEATEADPTATGEPTAVALVPDNGAGDSGDSSPASATPPGDGLPPEALPLALIGLAAALYLLLFVAGMANARRYAGGFVVEECPVCRQGNLVIDERRHRVLGIPRVRRTVRCDYCGSVLRQVGRFRWRYTVDGQENPRLHRQYNGRVITDVDLAQLDSAARLRRTLIGPQARPTSGESYEPPQYVEDDDES